MGHLVIFNSWGYVSSFGIFQSHYTTTLNVTPSAISWIGSLQLFLIYFVGTFSGRALDAGYYRTVLVCGSSLQILAVFMTSISSRYWQLFIAQGICKGLGDGLIFCPTVALVATYFSKRRASAMACAASGGATGGMIFPLIAQQLLPRLGFASTVRVMGFVILFNSVIAISLARVRLPARQTGPLVEWSAFKERRYALFCVAMFFNVWALFFAYFYVSFLPHDKLFQLLTRPRKNLKDQRLRQRYNRGLFFDLFDHPSRHEWCGISWPLDMWSSSGHAARTGHDHHTSLFHFRLMLVWLDRSQLAWRSLYFLRRVRILRRRYPKPFTSGLRQLDHRPHQDGDADGNVLVFHFFCVPDRPAVGRRSNSKG